MFQPELEILERRRLEELQVERLQTTLERVYSSVPFYRQRLDRAGVKPNQIRCVDDVRRLPFTHKTDLREAYPFGLFAVKPNKVARIHASSGTSGKPTVVGYTKDDLQRWAEVCARAIVTAGGKPGDRLHNAYGYGLFTGGLGLHQGAHRLDMTVIPASVGQRKRHVLLIQDFQPQGVAATPSFMLSLGETMKELGIDPRQTSLLYGIFGAEPWSEAMRTALEEMWGMDALDIYGLSEVIGPGVSIECREAKDGLHIAEDHFVVEVIDPDSAEPLPDGETGELVFTSLTKEAFPILRYRTGDIASLTQERCRCGRSHARMSRVKGRVDDMLIVRGVNLFPSELENVIIRVEQLAPHYQVVLSQKEAINRITLEVEVTTGWWEQQGKVLDYEREGVHQLYQRVKSLLKERLGITIEVALKPPHSLPRAEGKAVRVIDRRAIR
ncbi:phenylacetate--CoA ligase family protein [Desmospora activa]|uniref:Phenylacetate-coenzyme A ligase n=1 Tax=Desmospora activa DSM 45169 TaxID=1121389 RepID=A0A2T4Z7P7_9BACL|nr:phenylacetate--CoA ligase [Desmospora activa]PTM57916.1 phenylacetate-CoA ligase [Desmospora activa DSM 45169]